MAAAGLLESEELMGIVFSLLPLVFLGGVVYAVVAGLKTATDDGVDPTDATEVAKSTALHVGLFVALVAGAVGMIDILQSVVEEPDRLAGSNTDLARGLSLILVAGPAYALLLRAVAARTRARIATIGCSTRGWSVYLVAALATTLIATLTSVAQITYDLTDGSATTEPAELMQFVVWFGLWIVHWFVLRPWLRTRTDGHLAVGTIAGLSWLLAGVGAVLVRVLAAGYDAVFGEVLEADYDVAFWSVIAVVGGAVWAYHWLAVFNAPDASGVVEGRRRGSPFWYFTVVVAGVLPGLLTVIVTVTTMVSGSLIWFLGSTDLDGPEYFSPSPALITAAFLGVVTWAYHRWELHWVGEEAEGSTRNEAIRFHDYVVVAVGLIAVVVATASLIALNIETLAARASIAGSGRADNQLIVTLTVLAVGALVWWRSWTGIERHRAAAALDESDSSWRKLYLVASFGIGGLVFAVSITWVLFAVLRDLLDGAIGRETFEDLATPIGWAIAVVGAVWYHFGVWRSDRAVLAGRPVPAEPMPPPPGPTSALSRRSARPDDLGELFTLQQADRGDRLATAASIVEPVESLEQMRVRLASARTDVVLDQGRIVGFMARPFDGGEGPTQVVAAPDRSSTEIIDVLTADDLGPPDRDGASTAG